MKVKVFGPGCAKCNEAESLVREVAAARGNDVTVVKVSDLKEIMQAGILSTPAVSIDGVVKVTGRVPTKTEMAEWFDEACGAVPGTVPITACGATIDASGVGCACGTGKY